jgi:CheY-like chemotaxis protein
VAGGHIPAIALTGYVSSEDHARLLAAGFQTHLPKPVEPDTIVAAIASLASLGNR